MPDAAALPVWRTTLAVAIRPRLWVTALRQSRRMVAPGWWRRAPFLPRPDRGYLGFRLEAQYGGAGPPDGAATTRDVVSYLDWCRAEHRTLSERHASPR